MELLDEATVKERLAGVAWQRQDDTLVKTVILADFRSALDWINRVGELAEASNHHPDITLSWNRVTLALTTHSAGGLTSADFELARLIDGLAT